MKAGDFDIVEVVAKCKENDRKSQYIIYDRYYGKMMGVALRYFRNQDIACDIVQESFIKAFSKIEQFKGGTNFEGWLKRSVVNRALDELRKNKNVTFYGEDALYNVHEEENEDNSLYEGLDMSKILDAVHQLSDGYRTVFNLYVMDGLTHKEIASVLNITEGTSKSNYAKAKLKLKSILIKTNHLE